MSIDLEPIEKRCAAATAGPWQWREETFRTKYMVETKSGKWRARTGKKANSSWVILLVSPAGKTGIPSDEDELASAIKSGRVDEYDFRHIFALRWNRIRGDVLMNATPSKADCDFISNARSDVPELLAEVKRLRARVAELEAAK